MHLEIDSSRPNISYREGRTEIFRGTQTNKQIDILKNRYTDRNTDRQTDRHTYKQNLIKFG